ncbi:substrate-binding periplasmic protein [Pseudomonas sp. NPDC090201]|uniref:substrate-binding periplasmic protein n=1 Tax=Pseudomonas sp. NPDC090201 TaxID=3364475 RepID=UPI0037F95E0F
MSTTPRSVKRRSLAFCATVLALACLNARADTLQVVTEDSSYSAFENGKVVGVASEIVEQTLARAGITDYHMTLYPWARAYDMARLEPNVLIYPIIRSAERDPLFKWVGELDQVTPSFYKLRERRDVVVKTLQDARSYSVGVVRDDSRQEYLEGKGFSKMVVSANNLDNLRKLLSGQVLLVPMPEREAREQCDDLHIAYEDLEAVYTLDDLSKGLYVAISLKTPEETVKRITNAFAQLKNDGTVAKVLAR